MSTLFVLPIHNSHVCVSILYRELQSGRIAAVVSQDDKALHKTSFTAGKPLHMQLALRQHVSLGGNPDGAATTQYQHNILVCQLPRLINLLRHCFILPNKHLLCQCSLCRLLFLQIVSISACHAIASHDMPSLGLCALCHPCWISSIFFATGAHKHQPWDALAAWHCHRHLLCTDCLLSRLGEHAFSAGCTFLKSPLT